MPDPATRLVVGVDGSPDSVRALRWALGHAADTAASVHVVHASPVVPSVDTPYAPGTEIGDHAEQVLRFATGEAAASGAGVEVSTEEVIGGAAAVLVAASAGARAVVLGARGHGRLAGAVLGSVSQHVAAHATCPVVVVREPADPAATTVVLGVDRGGSSEQAAAFAVDVAGSRDAPLLALRAWQDRALERSGVVLALRTELDEEIRRAELQDLDAVLGPALEARPGVQVSRRVVPVHPQRALVDASQHATLVVVGSRGRGGLAGLLLGSVSRAVLQHAACPVAVVR